MSKSVKFVKIVTPIAFAIALSACGGGGSSFLETASGAVEEEIAVEEAVTLGVDNSSIQINAAFLDIQASSKQLFSSGSSPSNTFRCG